MIATDSYVPVAETRSIRKLVAVMHMDMVGYSRLIGLDDADTLSRLKALRNALIEPAIDEHGGRIIQTAGDSVLVVFDSIDGAVGCALNVQRLMPAYDGAHPPERQIRFRVGVEIGDVIADGTDVHGDGVNVAVRLQSMSPPGGIYVSRAVRDHVRAQSGLVFDSVGPLSLKNIARPVEAFSLRVTNTPSTASSVAPSSSPSLVILPFEVLGSDGPNSWLAEAITDDLTTELSRFSGIDVIARSRRTFAGDTDIQRIGRELSAGYAVQGSVRALGQRIWVNTQLIDTETGKHLHADRIPCVAANYDEVLSRIVRSLKLALVADRRRRIGTRPISDLTTADLLVLGQDTLEQPILPQNSTQARGFFEQALVIDPDLTEAQTGVAFLLVSDIFRGWSAAPKQDQAYAEQLLNKAIARDPNHWRAHAAMAALRFIQGCLEDSKAAWEMAIALDPHAPLSFCQLGRVLLFMGRLDPAVANIEKAICLSPREPGVVVAYSVLGHCRLLQTNVEGALEHLRRAHAQNSGLYHIHQLLAAAFGLAGELDRARASLAEAIRLKPQFNTLERIRAAHPWLTDRRYQELAEPTVLVGLRRAGLPDACAVRTANTRRRSRTYLPCDTATPRSSDTPRSHRNPRRVPSDASVSAASPCRGMSRSW